MLNEWMKQEKLKLQLMAIFNDKIYTDYQFANSYHMEIMLMYGKVGMSYSDSIEAASKHSKILDLSYSMGVNFDDYQVFKLITTT